MNYLWDYISVIKIIILFLVLIFHVWQRRKFYKLSWSLNGPLAFPLIGNALTFVCKDDDIFDRANKIVDKYSSPMRFWFGPKLTIVCKDVYEAEEVLSSMKFIFKDEVYRFMKEFVGDGLISGSGIKWRKDRRLIAPLFHYKNIEQYFSCILSHTKTLCGLLSFEVDKATFNAEHYLHRCVTDIVNESIIGIKTDAQNGELDNFLKEINRMYEIIHARILKVWLQVEWIFKLTHYWADQESGKRNVRSFMKHVLVKAKNEKIMKNGSNSILHQMLDVNDKIQFANDDEFIDHLTTLYSASEDTVTTICSFALVMLGMHPHIQDIVFEEIVSVLGKDKRSIEQDDVSRLKYLDMCIKETLRLFPIAPFLIRVSTSDYQLGKWLIPKGCSVVIAIHAIHRDHRFWEKPNEFYPEHFLPDAVKVRHPFAFIPFSAGPRGCIGKPYAYLAMKIILATILQNFAVEADGKLEDMQLKTDISVRFKDDLYPVRLKKRVYF